MNVYLIGYRGCGKSASAPCLAARLGREWVDADMLLEARAGRTIRRIFTEEGEEAFRRLETEILEELAARDMLVVSTGGGVILRPENRRLLRQGRVVWLAAPAVVLWDRMRTDPSTADRRPALAAGGLEEVETLLQQRTPLYAACADLTIETPGRTPDEIADLVARWLADTTT